MSRRKSDKLVLTKNTPVVMYKVVGPSGTYLTTYNKTEAMKVAKEILGYSYTKPWSAVDVVTTERLFDTREGDKF